MTRTLPFLALLAALAGPPDPVAAQDAACYADYKASRSDPLRLHYGVVELEGDDCTREAAEAALAARLPEEWNLLEVMDVFGPEGLDRRRESAGDFYLLY
ncbi:hypothetical protein JQC91_04955 [Jannaschia sp. Os4]|uniref:hypothetical protein n=1 Tax=Jannaschia sp. Os4 TaxID=2807617 RepID=UPI00193A5576|nr:hypothetical protein [Jannaschia sp. Os4]MBM2575647.1 hypothetical protein [Jannaschia sp. Os4]